MRSLKWYLAAACVFVAIGCNKDDDDEKDTSKAPEAPFLSPNMLLDEGGLSKLSAGDVRTKMEEADDLYLDEPESDDEDSDEDTDGNCEGLFESMVVHAKGDTYFWSMDFDLRSCKGAVTADEDAKITEARMIMYSSYRCEGADFSAIDGKTFKDAISPMLSILLSSCSTGQAVEELSNTETTVSMEMQGTSYRLHQLVTKSAPDGSACRKEKQGDLYHLSTCMSANRERTVLSGKIQSDETSLVTVTLEDAVYGSESDTFYSAGKAEIRVNQWAGELVYSGAATAPTWTLKAGDETITGTLASDSADESVAPVNNETVSSIGALSRKLNSALRH